jgi:hypothetical protein
MLYRNLLSSLALVTTVLSSPLPNVHSTESAAWNEDPRAPTTNMIKRDLDKSMLSSSLPDVRSAEVVPRAEAPGDLSKRNVDKFIPMGNGNTVEMEATTGPFTAGWNTDDFANMYNEAGVALVNALRRHTSNAAGLLFGFTDHNGNRHLVDATALTTAEAPVSVLGAIDNVNRALVAAEGEADAGNTGLIGTTRTFLSVFFGDVVAMSIHVALLN